MKFGMYSNPTLAEFEAMMEERELKAAAARAALRHEQEIAAKRIYRWEIKIGPEHLALAERLKRFKRQKEHERRAAAVLAERTRTCEENEQRRAAGRATRARNKALRLPDEKLRRSRVDWQLVLPKEVAGRQDAWERAQTALAMRASGMTYREVGRPFGVCATRAVQLVYSGERQRGKSPAALFLSSGIDIEGRQLFASDPVDRREARKLAAILTPAARQTVVDPLCYGLGM